MIILVLPFLKGAVIISSLMISWRNLLVSLKVGNLVFYPLVGKGILADVSCNLPFHVYVP